ncbi:MULTISPECIES: hypothetical protein [Litoreibacter]|uniref:EF hand n=1 Tax=Litoreibacter ascidiaceicola TaxID=1486859 RepID=A0A1M5DJU8_9RHOB|nr:MULTISPECIES: hypothetical protein [Litoreibacter]SHF67175.1 EF hand [Litoreibacter ascidiaceicola]
MTNKKALALGLLISVGLASATLADSGHGHDKKVEATPSVPGMKMQGGDPQMGMMGGDHQAIMRSMMQMHMAGMTGKGMEQTRMGMMDRDMMTMMMPGDGGQSMGDAMRTKIDEFDADNDGALTLAEFENLHMAALRERMVDRFQHLDSDGDGQITQGEIEAAGTRMGAMKGNANATGMGGQRNGDN